MYGLPLYSCVEQAHNLVNADTIAGKKRTGNQGGEARRECLVLVMYYLQLTSCTCHSVCSISK